MKIQVFANKTAIDEKNIVVVAVQLNTYFREPLGKQTVTVDLE